MFDGIFDTITTRISDAFSGLVNGLSDYAFLAEWYMLGLAVLGVALVITHFFTNTLVKGTFGVIVVAMGAYLAGMQVTWNRFRKRE